MTRREQVSEQADGYYKTDSNDYLKQLKLEDRQKLLETVQEYGHMNVKQLTTYTYINFPYYAFNSKIAENLLTTEQYNKVQKSVSTDNHKIIYTIGYEGISLEHYLNKLIKNGVKALVDVRKNPLSMKYGFSKKLLSKFCYGVGINYIHYPQVGIESNKRRNLDSQKDYDELFEDYKSSTLVTSRDAQKEILLLANQKKIALTCFEAQVCQCHRLHLANSLKSISNDFDVIHL